MKQKILAFFMVISVIIIGLFLSALQILIDLAFSLGMAYLYNLMVPVNIHLATFIIFIIILAIRGFVRNVKIALE
nr:MAG TPA: hypothetical protein [Herelleviridae sp.]